MFWYWYDAKNWYDAKVFWYWYDAGTGTGTKIALRNTRSVHTHTHAPPVRRHWGLRPLELRELAKGVVVAVATAVGGYEEWSAAWP